MFSPFLIESNSSKNGDVSIQVKCSKEYPWKLQNWSMTPKKIIKTLIDYLVHPFFHVIPGIHSRLRNDNPRGQNWRSCKTDSRFLCYFRLLIPWKWCITIVLGVVFEYINLFHLFILWKQNDLAFLYTIITYLVVWYH